MEMVWQQMTDSQFWSPQKLQDTFAHILTKILFWRKKNGWRYPQTFLNYPLVLAELHLLLFGSIVGIIILKKSQFLPVQT